MMHSLRFDSYYGARDILLPVFGLIANLVEIDLVFAGLDLLHDFARLEVEHENLRRIALRLKHELAFVVMQK